MIIFSGLAQRICRSPRLACILEPHRVTIYVPSMDDENVRQLAAHVHVLTRWHYSSAPNHISDGILDVNLDSVWVDGRDGLWMG
jgi:hypothetical protein